MWVCSELVQSVGSCTLRSVAGVLESPRLALGGKGNKHHRQYFLEVQEHIARAAYVAEGITHSTKCFCCFGGLT